MISVMREHRNFLPPNFYTTESYDGQKDQFLHCLFKNVQFSSKFHVNINCFRDKKHVIFISLKFSCLCSSTGNFEATASTL